MANLKTNYYTENNTRLGSCRSLTFCHVPKGAGFLKHLIMAKDPAVLFYTSDFLTGVAFLSMEQRGQYITLLCEQHQNGHIPKNHMISVCGSLNSPVVKKFIVDEDGNYYNKRMENEAIKRANYCKSRSNPNAGRKKKKSYDNSYDKSYDKSYGNHTENENRNRNKDKNRDKKPKTKHSFEKSPFYDYKEFRVALSDWPEEKVKWYYESAKNYSGANGAKYLNWVLAVRNWDRKNNDNTPQVYEKL